MADSIKMTLFVIVLHYTREKFFVFWDFFQPYPPIKTGRKITFDAIV